MKKNSITSGSLTAGVIRLAFPAIGMMYLQALYNIVDTLWVGRLGASALAGISTGGFVLWSIFALISIVSVGIQAVVSRRVGEGDGERSGRAAAQGLVFALISSVVLGAVMMALRGPLFSLMDVSPEVRVLGTRYLTILLWGIPTIFLSFVITAILQAAGDTYTPMKLMFWSLVLNAILDPLLIFGFGFIPAMGIGGASLATVISRLFFLMWGIAILASGQSHLRLVWGRRFRVDWKLYWQVVRIGLPASVTGFMFSFVYMILIRIVSDFGDHAIAALRIGHIVEFVNYCTGLGFSTAATTMVGQNLGAGDPKRAERSVYRIVFLVSAVIGFFSLFFFFVPAGIVSLFSSDPRVIQMGAVYLVILGYSQVFMGIETAVSGGFAGAGDTLPPMFVALPLTVLRIPVAYFLVYHGGMGIQGVWWAISGSTILKGVLLLFWFRLGRWKRRRV